MESSLVKHIRDTCLRYGSNEAYRYGENTVSYDELWSRAVCFSNALAEQSIFRGSKLAFYCDNMLDIVIGYIGCLIGGVTVVPLNLEDDVEMILPVLSSSEIEVVYVSPMSHARIAPYLTKGTQRALTSEALGLYQNRENCDWELTSTIQSHVSDSDVAFIFFTSGSTGRPKGVMLSHEAIDCYMMNGGASYNVRSDDVFLCHSAMHSDMCLFSLFLSLRYGATCVLIPHHKRWNPFYNIELIRSSKVSILEIVPSFLRLILSDETKYHSLTTVRTLITTGEKILIKEVNHFRKQFPLVQIVNLYGSSECNDILSYQIPKGGSDLVEIPLGAPLPYINAFLLNDDMQLCKDGEVGELFVNSRTLMKGYYGGESDPFCYLPGCGNARHYATGDLMFRKDGLYYYVERKDNSIKVNGLRVYPAVIESTLRSFPGVVEACVIPIEQEERMILVTFLYGVKTSPLEVRKYCSERLMPHYIPTKFVIMNNPLPKTSTGKLDSKQITSWYKNHS